jgi:hypothetical protein
MILGISLLPQFHGQIGLLAELELCLAPFVVVITLLVYRFLSRQTARRERTRQRQRASGVEKK